VRQICNGRQRSAAPVKERNRAPDSVRCAPDCPVRPTTEGKDGLPDLFSTRDGNGDFPVGEWLPIPVPVPANACGGAFSPIPVPVGEFIPVGNPAGNLSPLEVQYLKINLN
jgi:hypothetical protein